MRTLQEINDTLDKHERKLSPQGFEVVGGDVESGDDWIHILLNASSGGTANYWAEVTAVTDANNYTVSVWANRTSHTNGDSALYTSKQCRVPDIVDQLAIGDTFEVVTTTLTGEDYIATQQLGAVG